MVDVLNVVKSDVGTLGNRLAAGDSPSHILQILEGSRQLSIDEVGIEGAVRHVRERRHGQLLVVRSVRHDAESAGLREARGGAGVGAEAEPETLEVERPDAGARAPPPGGGAVLRPVTAADVPGVIDLVVAAGMFTRDEAGFLGALQAT